MSYIFLLRGNLLVWQQQKQQQIEGQVAERGKETEKETFHLIIHSPNGLAQTRSQELLLRLLNCWQSSKQLAAFCLPRSISKELAQRQRRGDLNCTTNMANQWSRKSCCRLRLLHHNTCPNFLFIFGKYKALPKSEYSFASCSYLLISLTFLFKASM